MRLIDADAFKEYISVSFDNVAPELSNGYLWLAKQITEDLLKDIDDAPTVQPQHERPKEHWMLWGKYTDVYPDDIPVYRCSKCFCQSTKRSKFCPNCGASMAEDGE